MYLFAFLDDHCRLITGYRWTGDALHGPQLGGRNPELARRIRCTCAAVRSGFSRFNLAASSNTALSVRGSLTRGAGSNSSNPPAR